MAHKYMALPLFSFASNILLYNYQKHPHVSQINTLSLLHLDTQLPHMQCLVYIRYMVHHFHRPLHFAQNMQIQ